MRHWLMIVIGGVFGVAACGSSGSAEEQEDKPNIYAKDNLVAWCIVPFDGRKRGPQERAEMLARLGIRKLAYDYRAEHIPTFDEEIEALRQHGIELTAWWFPTRLNDEARHILSVLERQDVKTQLWVTGGGGPKSPAEQQAWVEAEAQRVRPIAEAAARIGCQVGLYNHGGWFGEPENQIAIIRELNLPNVGIVYNLHHGHDHLDRLADLLEKMRPYLYAVNLNGMVRGGDQQGQKILPLGTGDLDLDVLSTIRDSGYAGPIGILNHTNRDAEARLLDNLDGLAWLARKLDHYPASAKPVYRSWQPPLPAEASGAPQSSAPYRLDFVVEIVAEAGKHGVPERGAALFANAKSACLSCHKVGDHGSSVGPELTSIGKQQSAEKITESVFWPKREVKPEHVAFNIITSAGEIVSGYRIRFDEITVVLRDPTTGAEKAVSRDDIAEEVVIGSLMPDGLTAAMTRQQQLDLIAFLVGLGHGESLAPEALHRILGRGHSHVPAPFEYERDPIHPERWPAWKHPVNRDRLYDFYTKEAEYFRAQEPTPPLLPAFPGLDGGQLGHWGNQNEATWVDGRWNDTTLGSVQCGVFHGAGLTVPRGVCLQLGEAGELSACFNPDTLTYDVLWTGGFVKFSSVRHGFLNGLILDGKPLDSKRAVQPAEPFEYHGFYRYGRRVLFAYRIGDTDYLDAPWVKDGQFERIVAPRDEHPLMQLVVGGPPQWSQEIATQITAGAGRPYAVDTIELPFNNPWKALMFCGGHDFLADGSALVCTMQGDVWHVSGLTGTETPATARWRRFASGLHHALGLVVTDDGIFVQGRDQLTRLHDLNQDGEADFYECFSNTFQTSPAGHDFICGLQGDAAGNFYTASGNQGLLRMSPDGKRSEVIATGFRNPDGLGLTPDGMITVPCSEGSWTPASMICAIPLATKSAAAPPFFGHGGPRDGRPPELPLVYLPRGLDNSSGGQAYVDSDRWGPLKGQMVHFSSGMGRSFLLLRDEVDGQLQGGVVPLVGEFRSGGHRGRFNPVDGQLYVSGMAGWGSYTPDDGCFHRLRYTGDRVQLPAGFHVYQNGVAVTFTEPIESSVASHAGNQFAQCWNYRYSGAYGSPEFATQHPGLQGHDHLPIESAHVLLDERTLFLEIPDLQPVNQLHLRLGVDEGDGHNLFLTVHKLDQPFTEFPGYRPTAKTILPHPILSDLALAMIRVPNPFTKRIPDARSIVLETGKNLTFATRILRAKPGEPVALTLQNPDVVPHNWALVKPGQLQAVGELANRLVADPQGFARHYIPQTDDVLFYTDVVPPKSKFTIYFRAPQVPGRYPYLCTFPGHWMVMNGDLIVE